MADSKSVPIPLSTLTAKILAKTIDHTLLKLDATEDQVTQICKEAIKYDFKAVCVRLNFVAHCVKILRDAGKDKSIKVACVIGFHEGTQSPESKIQESKDAVAAGATELDVVLNPDWMAKEMWKDIMDELLAIRFAAPAPIVLKLILETSRWDEKQILVASTQAGLAHFDFIKTSTGFHGRGASVEDIRTMRSAVQMVEAQSEDKWRMKIKASGGVRTLEDAKKMLDAGAERIGASAGVAIMKEFLGEGKAEGGSGY